MYRNTVLVTALSLIAAAAVTPNPVARAGKALTADQVIDRMIDDDPLGYGGAEAHVRMVLVDNRNNQRQRELVMMSRRDGDTRRVFVRFSDPADIAGTSFLGIDDDGDRVQHLFMPALGRTRRISGAQRDASFVGTDYSFADLDYRDIEDSKKKLLPDEEVGGSPCYVVELVPDDSKARYGRIVVWVSKQAWVPLRIRFYDRSDNETKRLTVTKLQKAGDRFVIGQSKMVDLKREHTTVMQLTDIDAGKSIPLDQFSVRALERE